jgi:SAM-dependent methyltransferase
MAKVDLFDSTYGHFTDDVLARVRQETFGRDIGQNSWITVEEYDGFLDLAQLTPDSHMLEIASGSGGPSLYAARKTGCRVTGIDANPAGVGTAEHLAAEFGLSDRVSFQVGDAASALPFRDGSFDAVMCVDSMNHFPNRLDVLREWHRVLAPGRRAVFTDPVVVSGPVTNADLETRASIGLFLFVPAGVNERLIAEAGFHLVEIQDVSSTAATVARRWCEARANHESDLKEFEGPERFEGLQRFFDIVARLTGAGGLSRMLYCVERTHE